MKTNEKIDLAGNLLNFISDNNTYSDLEDVRSITIDSIAQSVQSFLISIILSKELENIDYVQAKIYDKYTSADLETLGHNFDGFIKDAVFTKLFISTEINFRTIARHLEANPGSINKTSIKATFEKLLDTNVTNLFSTIDAYEKDIIIYFFYLRNTIHNVGIHTNPNHSIEIEDKTSVINTAKVKLELIENQTNNINYKDSLLLFEQVIKVLIKFNSLLPVGQQIKHPLADFGYN
ncbi:hypothetical protein EG339_23900 [Chryseobacterium bernardetii]|uniref:RiboL-PSP-HEPN domain-containing protein n=1 Tax=Chryseobacterium bernardetii TaxID=1241978 RepID=A0A3G6THD7_9FLAO|nr:hypothetical protein [Chryseobacterium bernardetii]AZB27417.1 hypothetical protein EG339_23900 [Chryseobacterium bernardetii]